MLKVLAELQALQLKKLTFFGRVWKSNASHLSQIKALTEHFHQYLRSFSLRPEAHQGICLENISNNRYLPEKSIVLRGSAIFKIFFEGTTPPSRS